MSIRTRMRRNNTLGRGRWVLLGILAGTALLAAAIFAQTRPRTNGTQAAGNGVRRSTALRPPTEVKPAQRRPLSYYLSGVRNDMFGAIQAPQPAVAQPQPRLPEPPPAAPEVIDPFADYAYTGTIMMGDQALALIENAKTKEGMYVKVGDQFLGGTVTEVTEKGITVSVAGTPRTLYKTEEFKLTPLDKDAPYRTAQPGGMPGMPGVPGMPGAPGTPGMGPGGMGMGFPGMGALPPDVQQRFQQRFQGMTPEQLQEMRNRWMNRSFEGGQRRRRFF